MSYPDCYMCWHEDHSPGKCDEESGQIDEKTGPCDCPGQEGKSGWIQIKALRIALQQARAIWLRKEWHYFNEEWDDAIRKLLEKK